MLKQQMQKREQNEKEMRQLQNVKMFNELRSCVKQSLIVEPLLDIL